ncbi:hypothetical protein LPJ61_003432 [Coemansia biformis]|uniref:E2F-associated phosphoprotein n=1 Tax=Coemansia biformis TaxID=1286918 RepID=A0A9W7YC66_9FUNG|nr:hypothetical protein LPJ61_003432 [Coemansia biformis]
MESDWSTTSSSDSADDEGSVSGSEVEMHDAQADDRDAAWVAEQFPGTTDAVLSCPMCFTQVCFVCQQHVRFPGQYRAHSVVHCRTLSDQLFVFGTRGRLEPAPDSTPFEGEVFRLVVCAKCGARVGVVDPDGAYHLFHVVTGS